VRAAKKRQKTIKQIKRKPVNTAGSSLSQLLGNVFPHIIKTSDNLQK
jgi:hypothetical protein